MFEYWRNAFIRLYRPYLANAEETYSAFSASGRVLFLFFAGLFCISAAVLLFLLNNALMVIVPARGGSLTEGLIGTPRFINPVLAISDADNDLTALTYSGALKATPEGHYVPDLAQSYTTSQDGLTYTVVLRGDATFQDGSPVTADDVVFTIAKTQSPTLKSPERANWVGVDVQKIDAHTVSFTLKNPYAPFIENLDIGILPKALWQNVSDEEFPFSTLNTSPVGSGPFRVVSISRTASGIPSSYTLKPFGHYALGEPYLDTLTLRFYQNEDALVGALKQGAIEAASGISPANLGKLGSMEINRAPLNRVFGVFFNQNQSVVLRDPSVRQALGAAINRDELVEQVLGGYGTPLSGPVPPNILGVAATKQQTASSTKLVEAARTALVNAGWKAGVDGILQKTSGKGKTAQTTTLSFSLATGNVPELRAAAEYLRKTWDALGAKVQVQVYDQGDLSENVIRPRHYDALLFGEVVGRELDLFAFWDSSQRNDPGLNIALYANSTADKILEQLRQVESGSQRRELYRQFEVLLGKDLPAIFLYAPDFVYTMSKDILGVNLGFIEKPSDRFLSITNWHTDTDSVWSLFTPKVKP